MLGASMQRTPHSLAPLDSVLDALRHAASLDFERAHPIPPQVNHSEAFHELEQDAVLFESRPALWYRRSMRQR